MSSVGKIIGTLPFVALAGVIIPTSQAAPDPGSAAPASAASTYERQAPRGAPNVVLVLLDDVGFGSMSAFGGPVDTPAFDSLAEEGLRFNRFHTTGICSPTRASLLSGRNPHVTGIGSVMNAADARPGYSGFHGKDTATIAKVLHDNGYATAAFGKWHQTPDWELSPAGPFDRWPTGEGFDTFYGFQGGETDQFNPTLYQGTSPVLRPPGDHYHLTEDLADHAIKWMRNIRAFTVDRPFFLYFSAGGIHAPIQVPKEWIDRYRGKFDGGWDNLREEILARQIRLGVVPAGAKLTPRPAEMPAWDTLKPEQKRFASRLMESYAGYLAHTDAQVARLVGELKKSGQFDNTLFVYIAGDNGASAEGGPEGSLSYFGALIGASPRPGPKEFEREDEIGGPTAYSHINAGWAWAADTPFQWTKQVASYLGATRNAMVITWPDRIRSTGGLRSQFSHVNDIVPTILDVTGIAPPATVDGVPQKPMDGISLAYTFDDPKAPERHRTQYFEVFGHRAIYHDGWMASAFHGRVPWQPMSADHPVSQDRWELYDLRNDFSQGTDLATKYPAKLKEMQALFMSEAAANNVLPLGGQGASKAGLPNPSRGRTEVDYHAGDIGIPEPTLPHLYSRSWTIRAQIDTAENARGVVAALGGMDAGMSLYLDQQGRPSFTYRLFDTKTVHLRSPEAAKPGPHILQIDFDYAGGGFGKGGTLRFSVDGQVVGSDELPLTSPTFSIHETFGVGIDTGAPVGNYPESYHIGNPINNAVINRISIRSR